MAEIAAFVETGWPKSRQSILKQGKLPDRSPCSQQLRELQPLNLAGRPFRKLVKEVNRIR